MVACPDFTTRTFRSFLSLMVKVYDDGPLFSATSMSEEWYLQEVHVIDIRKHLPK